MKFLIVFLLLAPFAVIAQKDSIRSVSADTIFLREYDKNGKLTTTTWIGDTFQYSHDYYALGEAPTHWDTLEAFQLSGVVYTREYGTDGKLISETKEVLGDGLYERLYFFSDSVFGYEEYLTQEGGIINTHSYNYEFWPDSTPRIIGESIMFKTEGRYQTFYQNGNRQCDCFYRDGERDSIQTMYHENGQMQWKLLYKDGKPWEVFVNLDAKGNELEKGTLKDGSGTLLIYDNEGKLLRTYYYKKGKLKDTVEN